MKILIDSHSVVDIITNSSTEIFVGMRGHSEEVVREIVDEVCRLYHRTADELSLSIDVEDWDSWANGQVVIRAEQWSLPDGMARLLRNIFEVNT